MVHHSRFWELNLKFCYIVIFFLHFIIFVNSSCLIDIFETVSKKLIASQYDLFLFDCTLGHDSNNFVLSFLFWNIFLHIFQIEIFTFGKENILISNQTLKQKQISKNYI